MPYQVVKSGDGYKVRNKDTGKTYSKKPLPKARAEAQMRALYANMSSTEESIVRGPLLLKLDEALGNNNLSPSVPLDSFTKSYMETALFSSTDDNDQPLDKNYSIHDISEETKSEMMSDCADFQEMASELLQALADDATDVRAGKDFWLTRNGHGAGFWDGDWEQQAGAALTKIAKSFGEVNLYVGDDGKIYN